MTTKGRVVSLLAGTCVVALVVAAATTSSTWASIASGVTPLAALHKPLPSDASLIERFTRDRVSFDYLRALLTDDPAIVATRRDTPPERLQARVEALRASLGIQDGLSPADTNEVLLPAFSYNLPSNGPTKGYVWRRNPPRSSTSSLDGYRRSPDEWGAYRPIGGGWYLYLAWGD